MLGGASQNVSTLDTFPVERGFKVELRVNELSLFNVTVLAR